jgi:hypothetical protein
MKEETMNTRRITTISLTLFLALLIMVTPVFAGQPHFGKLHASGPDNVGNLTVSYSVGGFPYGIMGGFIEVSSEAIYACKPADGNFPLTPDKQVITGGSSYPLGGPTKGEVLFQPPETSLFCDPPMIVALAMVTYNGLDACAIYDFDLNYVCKSAKGTFSEIYYGYTP